ncbi:MAG: aminopeptidase P family protein [Ilumatobacteraceae bacterium]|nr:aminopeptidase P family protein [Ilumatobacteraceae bacterium]
MLSALLVDGRDRGFAERLVAVGATGAVVTSHTNVRWLTGFTGSAGTLVVSTEDGAPMTLVTDGRYAEQATRETAGSRANVHVVECRSQVDVRAAVASAIIAVCGSSGPVGLETSDISLADYEALAAACEAAGSPLARPRVLDASPILADLRRSKSSAEIERITRAASIADAALAEIGDVIGAGSTEIDVRDALESAMRRHGADDVSFATIVASGENAALPHHRPSARRLRSGEAVVVDFGALVDGYHSDMTRTFVVEGANAAEMLERHAVVRAACEAGVATVAPGVVAHEVDAACRRVLASAGLESELTHGVGHGVGLLIHEAPWVNARSYDVLRPGDVVTVEPGAYRVGVGGARVEELLLVTDSGHLVLSNSPKEPTCPPSPPTTSRTE